MYVTENGCAAEDYVNPDGVVDDVERIEYLHGHLRRPGARSATAYPGRLLLRSLRDNFEWTWGYRSASACCSWTTGRSDGHPSAAPSSTRGSSATTRCRRSTSRLRRQARPRPRDRGEPSTWSDGPARRRGASPCGLGVPAVSAPLDVLSTRPAAPPNEHGIAADPPDVLPLWWPRWMRRSLSRSRAVEEAMAIGDTATEGSAYGEAIADFAAARWGWRLDVAETATVPDVMRASSSPQADHRPWRRRLVDSPVYTPFNVYLVAHGPARDPAR